MNIIERLFGTKRVAPSPPAPPAEKPMREFLIRRADGEWFDLDAERFEAVLKPASFESHTIDGWGDHRIEVRGCAVSFSFEDPGIQVCFENHTLSDEDATRIAEEVAASITAATGQRSRVVPL